MNSRRFLPAVIVLCIGALGLGAAATANGPVFPKKLPLRLEIYGGFIAMQPGDLNLLADYYNAYPLFFYSGQYDYLHGQAGDNFTYSMSRSGDERLKGVGRGLPAGIRLRYDLSAALAVSVSLEYFRENRLSGTQVDYRIEDRSGGLIQTTPEQVVISYPDFFLGVSAWVPQVGIHWIMPLGGRWQAGASLSAGPLLARCRSVVETRSTFQYHDGYWSENRSLLEMKGAATGLAVELSLELRRRLSRRLSFFLAPGFAFRRAAAVEGSGHNLSLAADSNAVQDLVENSWNGRWRKKDVFYQRSWGQFSQTYYGNYFSAAETGDDFVLDLSGIQVKAGFAWSF